MFYSMVGKYKQFKGSNVQYVGNKQVIWKYMFLRSTLPTR